MEHAEPKSPKTVQDLTRFSMCLIKKITSEIIHLIIRMHSVNSEGHYQQHCFHESGNGPGMSPW